MRLLTLLLLGVIAVAVAAVLTNTSGNAWALAMTGALLALAALVAGGLLGFLFGVPRFLTSERAAGGTDPVLSAHGYLPNSNLEQVSDWLTKILIGVTLTQLGEIPGLIQRLVDYVRGPFGAAPASTPFVLSTLVLYAIGGFLVGYLWCRLYLGRALRLADRQSLEEIQANLEADLTRVRTALQESMAATGES
jgi:hypothetical protein